MVNFYNCPWFHVTRPAPTATLRLFCFPYAGGSANIYHEWADSLPHEVEVIGVQYPGRGSRFSEPLIPTCQAMVAALLPQIRFLTNKPFAFFGHSNGGLISYELARALQRAGNQHQVHHFVSGHRAVHLPRTGHVLHTLPDEMFLRELERLGGTPPELLVQREILELFMPVLRADFSLSETYQFPGGAPLKSNMTLLCGEGDSDVPANDMLRWAELIDGEIDHMCFDGDHFFINSHRKQVLELVGERLGEIVGAAKGEHRAA